MFEYGVYVPVSVFKREMRQWLRRLDTDPELIDVLLTRNGRVIGVLAKHNASVQYAHELLNSDVEQESSAR